MRTYTRAAAQDSEQLAADRAWVRWGTAAAVTGMLAWVAGFALIPLDAKLDEGRAASGPGAAGAHRPVVCGGAAGGAGRGAAGGVLRRAHPPGPGEDYQAGVCCACPWPGA